MKKPSKAWGSDITYIQTKDRFVCLTTIVDLYDRKIIGWSLIYGNKLISKEQMKLEVFEYIEIWYNNKGDILL